MTSLGYLYHDPVQIKHNSFMEFRLCPLSVAAYSLI